MTKTRSFLCKKKNKKKQKDKIFIKIAYPFSAKIKMI